jgi:hypothetical protein
MRTKIGAAALAIAMEVGLAACSGPGIPPPSGRGGQDDAEHLVSNAMKDYDQRGTVVFTDMSAPNKTYIDRDLYVYVIDPNRRVIAHSVDPTYIGQDVAVLVDADGVPIGETILLRADADGEWVDYWWMDPMSNTRVQKRTYVVLHDGYIFASDYYPVN